MRCFHNARIWLAHARSVDNTLSSLEIRVTYCMQECQSKSLSENKTLEPEQIKALELRLTGRDVLTILATGYGKFLFGKVFHLELECERVIDVAALGQWHRQRTFPRIWIDWAWLCSRPFERLNQTFTWIFPLLSANMALQLDDLLHVCQIHNVHCKFSAELCIWKFSKESRYKIPHLPNIFRLLSETSLACSFTWWTRWRRYTSHGLIFIQNITCGYWQQAIMRGRQDMKSYTEKSLCLKRANSWA